MDPSFSILYADLKAGKTACAIAAFPGATFIAAPGALSPAESVWGLPPRARVDLETFTDVRQLAERTDTDLVIDDATLIADRTAAKFGEKLSGWDVWGAVLNSAIRMRDTLRRRGRHIVMTCHPRPPHVEQGVRVRGGPSFQGQCFQKLPAAADLLLRAEPKPGVGDPTYNGPKLRGWSMIFRTAWHPDWLQGSRYDTPDMAPMNLGEILRCAGFTIPRLRGLEWQESLANALANRILEVGIQDEAKVSDAIQKIRDLGLARFSKTEAHVYWAVSDGYARAILRISRAAQRTAIWGI